MRIIQSVTKVFFFISAMSVFSAAEALTYSDTINWTEDGQAAYLTCSSSVVGISLICQYHTATRDGSFTANPAFFRFEGVRFQLRQPGPTNFVCARGASASGDLIFCWDITYSTVTQTLKGSGGIRYYIGDDSDGTSTVTGDLILNLYDNCDYVINVDQLDTDGDGQGDACDTDDDNDGVLDTNDAFPLDATESVDTDHDGIGNNADLDDDNDGLTDVQEAVLGTNPLLMDTDSDGVGDNADNCPLTFNIDQQDTDGDGQGDACDADDDNDGVLDVNDAFPLNPAESVDTDHDGIGNNADWDDDGDGVPDTVDAAPLNGADTSEIILPLDAVYKGGLLQSAIGK